MINNLKNYWPGVSAFGIFALLINAYLEKNGILIAYLGFFGWTLVCLGPVIPVVFGLNQQSAWTTQNGDPSWLTLVLPMAFYILLLKFENQASLSSWYMIVAIAFAGPIKYIMLGIEFVVI